MHRIAQAVDGRGADLAIDLVQASAYQRQVLIASGTSTLRASRIGLPTSRLSSSASTSASRSISSARRNRIAFFWRGPRSRQRPSSKAARALRHGALDVLGLAGGHPVQHLAVARRDIVERRARRGLDQRAVDHRQTGQGQAGHGFGDGGGHGHEHAFRLDCDHSSRATRKCQVDDSRPRLHRRPHLVHAFGKVSGDGAAGAVGVAGLQRGDRLGVAVGRPGSAPTRPNTTRMNGPICSHSPPAIDSSTSAPARS
jgi:hypothetical protein